MSARVIVGDSLEVLRGMPDNSVDSVVTDPPYGLKFMGNHWDAEVPRAELWREALRVLKPGGHLLAFFGPRTYHRGAVEVEDAGFEVRDCITWVYGQGFPKNLDVSKAIDKLNGAEREVVGKGSSGSTAGMQNLGPSGIKGGEYDITAPASDEAKKWAGWGTCLTPASAPIVVARKPFKGTVAANVLAFGTSALNVDGCRVPTSDSTTRVYGAVSIGFGGAQPAEGLITGSDNGRFPANLIHDGSAEVLEMFPGNNPGCKPHRVAASAETVERAKAKGWGMNGTDKVAGFDDGDDLSAARFFYCAKPSKAERGAGNTHPTVKPAALMRYLCRLVTPPGGVVLDPFTGSGTTGVAALAEGFSFIGIEREADFAEIARRRCGIDDETTVESRAIARFLAA
jgi:DNA modification methylase